jgi:hypothetical protein
MFKFLKDIFKKDSSYDIIVNSTPNGKILNYIARDVKNWKEGRGLTKKEAIKNLKDSPFVAGNGYKVWQDSDRIPR